MTDKSRFSGHVKMVGGKELIERYANEREFESESAFARFLHEVEPTRSVDGWRGAILRWKKAGGQISYTVWNGGKKNIQHMKTVPDELKQEFKVEVPPTMKTYYDKEADIYLTYMAQCDNIISIDGEKHRAMKRAYSDSGGRLTVEQMATKFEFPILWMRDYIRAYQWKHPMSPYTDEEMINKSEQELIIDYLEMKRTAVLERSKRAHFNNAMKDANKWRNLEENFYGEFKASLNDKYLPPKQVKRIKMDKANPYAVVLSPTDLHFGSGAWVDETGNHYDTNEARSRLLDRTQNLISRLPGRPEKIVVATGSDWFHIDNEQGMTTSSTPQDMSASPTQIFMDGCMLAKEHIEMLRGVCPIEVVFMRGNHDRHLSLALMMYLKATYESIKDVTVIVDPKLRQYLSYGNTLLGFTHGDGVKGMDLPSLMAKEEWKGWGSCEHKIWFHGHLHHQQVIEKGGAMVVQLPSLAGDDRWHYRKGYVLARPGISAHLIDHKLGLIGNLFAPVINNE
jgi:predicted phosphodiesterase